MNFNSFQQLIAHILLVSLFLQSCSGGFDNNPLIPTREKQPAYITTHTQEITGQTNIQTLVDQTLAAQGGHAVTFYEYKGQVQASVQSLHEKEKIYNGIPIEVKEGTDTATLLHLPDKVQAGRIHIQKTSTGKPTKVIIYKEAGLMGGSGGRKKKQEKGSTDEESSEYSSDEEYSSETEEEEDYVIRNIHRAEYIKGDFQSTNEGTVVSTLPYCPMQIPRKSQGVYQEKPKLLPRESVLKRIAKDENGHGIDGRHRIRRTTEWPYLFHGQLELRFPFGKGFGSGTLIGPQHILTAAHNIYDLEDPDNAKSKRVWATDVAVRLGLNGDDEPYGKVLVNRIYTFKRWVDYLDQEYDMALLVLKRPIGVMTGWCGILAASNKDLANHNLSITGYPYDKGGKQMWTMSHTVKQVLSKEIIYEIDTYEQQSGSGIILEKWSSPYVVGVHTLGENLKIRVGNSGVRLSLPKANKVIEWIRSTLDSKENVENSLSPATMLTIEAIDKLCEQAIEGDILALEKLLYAANHINDPHAQYVLGDMYEQGLGVTQNYIQAAELYKKSAKQNHAVAQNDLGNLYRIGLGVSKSDRRAVRLFQESANQKYMYAQYNLGHMYEKGLGGLNQDSENATSLYKRAAKQGHKDAKKRLRKLTSKTSQQARKSSSKNGKSSKK